MGSNQVLGAEMYRSALQGEPLGRVQTLMTTFPYSGSAGSYSKSNGITDSAAAGTCLATGQKTKNGMLGLGPDSTRLTTIAEELKAQGWGIGIMTTVAIDHVFGGAGFHYPQGKKNKEEVNLYRLAEERGYTVVHGMEELSEIPESRYTDISKMILVQKDDDQGAKHGSNLPYAIDRKEGDLSLQQIVSTAIPFLAARHERFFMMVEGGMIDYACHSDDAATAFGEVWDMDEAMHEAYAFYKQHPDETLIIVTADHETGGLALGNSDYTLHLDVLQNQQCSGWILQEMLLKDKKKPSWKEVKQLYREQLGFWDKVEITAAEERELKTLYKNTRAKESADAGIALLNKKAHIEWTTRAHTAHVVPIFAIGPGAEIFSGWHDNTEIVPLIRKVVKE